MKSEILVKFRDWGLQQICATKMSDYYDPEASENGSFWDTESLNNYALNLGGEEILQEKDILFAVTTCLSRNLWVILSSTDCLEFHEKLKNLNLEMQHKFGINLSNLTKQIKNNVDFGLNHPNCFVARHNIQYKIFFYYFVEHVAYDS